MKNKKVDNLMNTFRTGCVFKDKHKYLAIVYNHRYVGKGDDGYYVCDWVSFTSSNCSGSTRFETVESEEICHCGEYFYDNGIDICIYDEECEDCKGTGKYKLITYGMDSAKFLAPNVASYIKSKLLKKFDFN